MDKAKPTDASTQWTDWIEHKAGDPCPIPDAKAGEYHLKFDDGFVLRDTFDPPTIWSWGTTRMANITHYRLRKPSPDYRALLEMAVEALEENICPRPIDGKDTIKQCVDAGFCGCGNNSTLTTIKTALEGK